MSGLARDSCRIPNCLGLWPLGSAAQLTACHNEAVEGLDMNKDILKDMRVLHKQLIDISTQICNLSDCLDASEGKKMGRSLMYETLSSIHSLCG